MTSRSIPDTVPKGLPSISIVVPVYRGGAEFRRCLAGLSALTPQPEEVIVIVDGEDDGSGDAAKACGARVQTLPHRSGPAAARNAGAGIARGEILLFLDADVVPAPTLIAQVRQAFSADPRLAALIGSYDAEPGDPGFLSQYRNLLHHYTHQTADARAHTFWGACGAVRREVFSEIGGFDERIVIPAMEDIELGHRLVRAGQPIRLDRDLQVKHLKRWEAWGMLRTDIFQRAIPWARLILQEGRLPQDLNLRLSSRVSGGLAWLLLGGLLGAAYWPASLFAAAAAALALLVLNAPFYRFLLNHRGLGFMLRSLPWHWLYYLYASGGFAAAMLTESGCRKHPPRFMETTRTNE